MSATLAQWADRHGVEQTPIQPGKPAQNAYIERFNRTYRQEVLDVDAFSRLDEVRDTSTRWRYAYNADRPHTALDRQTPWGYLQAHLTVKDQAAHATATGVLEPRASPVYVSEPRGSRTPAANENVIRDMEPQSRYF